MQVPGNAGDPAERIKASEALSHLSAQAACANLGLQEIGEVLEIFGVRLADQLMIENDLLVAVMVDQRRDRRDDRQERQEHKCSQIGRRQTRISPAPSPEVLVGGNGPRTNRPVVGESPQFRGHVFRAGETIARHLGKSLENDGLQVAGNSTIELPQRHRGLFFDPLNQLELILAIECRAKRQEFVESGTQGVDIAPDVGDSTKPLGGHVP